MAWFRPHLLPEISAGRASRAIAPDDMRKSVLYAEDKYRFGAVVTRVQVIMVLGFLAFGGLDPGHIANLRIQHIFGGLAGGAGSFG